MKQVFSRKNIATSSSISIFMIVCITTALLVSCQNKEPVMVNVRPKDMNRTGERYYEDWRPMEVRTVETLKRYRQKDIPRGRYDDRTDMTAEKTGFYYTKKIDGKWWAIS